jgi:hypothetical protein
MILGTLKHYTQLNLMSRNSLTGKYITSRSIQDQKYPDPMELSKLWGIGLVTAKRTLCHGQEEMRMRKEPEDRRSCLAFVSFVMQQYQLVEKRRYSLGDELPDQES